MPKARDAFRTISEVATWLDTPAHVLRFWESKFPQVKPVKRAGGRRYYRPEDMALLGGIKTLLHEDGLTIKGAQKLLRDKGVRHVSALGPQPLDDDDMPEGAGLAQAVAADAAPVTGPDVASPEAGGARAVPKQSDLFAAPQDHAADEAAIAREAPASGPAALDDTADAVLAAAAPGATAVPAEPHHGPAALPEDPGTQAAASHDPAEATQDAATQDHAEDPADGPAEMPPQTPPPRLSPRSGFADLEEFPAPADTAPVGGSDLPSALSAGPPTVQRPARPPILAIIARSDPALLAQRSARIAPVLDRLGTLRDRLAQNRR